MLISFLMSCVLYTYDPIVRLESVVVGASDGELYITSELLCYNNNPFVKDRLISVGEQITRCKYHALNDNTLCRNIATNESIFIGLNGEDNDYFSIKPTYKKICKFYGFKKEEEDNYPFSAWTNTEDPLDNNEH